MGVDGGKGGSCPLEGPANLCTTGPALFKRPKRFGWSKGIRKNPSSALSGLELIMTLILLLSYALLIHSVIPSAAWSISHYSSRISSRRDYSAVDGYSKCAIPRRHIMINDQGHLLNKRINHCTRMVLFSTAPPVFSRNLVPSEDIMSGPSITIQGPPSEFKDIDGSGLRRDGLSTFSVDLDDVEDVARMYRRLRQEHAGFRRCRPSLAPVSRRGARANIVWTEEIPFRTEASGFPLRVPAAEDDGALAFEVYTTGLDLPPPMHNTVLYQGQSEFTV